MTDTPGAMPSPADGSRDWAQTGIAGLDDVLAGGLARNRLYLVEGTPGTGKTTLALQFLLEGRRLGERGLYVTLSESAEELWAAAATHAWSLDGISVMELISEASLGSEQEQTLLHPAEFELSETIGQILQRVEQERPARLVLDSL
jgi:circadian clock protein KaiC